MPTIKPRITVTLPPHVGETFRRLAALQKRSAGAVCAELLEASHEPVMRVVAILEAATEAPLQVREGVRRAAEQAEFEAVGQVGKSLKQLDWILEEVRSESRAPGEKGKGASGTKAPKPPSRGRGRAAPNPRPSNTGVRSTKRNTRGKK